MYLLKFIKCSLWGSNPRPWAHKTHALTNCAKGAISYFIPLDL